MAKASENLATETQTLLVKLGVNPAHLAGGTLVAKSPITGEVLARIPEISAEAARVAIEKAHAAFLAWRVIPAPKRGEYVRQFGDKLRAIIAVP